MVITQIRRNGEPLDVLSLFGGSEDLQAVRLPDDGTHTVYAVGDAFEVYGYFRFDDGWVYTPRPGATVDFERRVSDEDWGNWDEYLGTSPSLTWQLLDKAREGRQS